MLQFNGHMFDGKPHCSCCVGDASKVVIDPTGTKKLRNRFAMDARRRINQLRIAVQQMINKQDILGLKPGAALQIMAPGVTMLSTRQEMFQRWFNQALISIVMQQDGEWMRPYLDRAYLDGSNFANEQLDETAVAYNTSHRMDGLFALAKMELKGIMDVTSQQATRAANLGITTNTKPAAIVRGIWEIIERTTFMRVNAMIQLMVVKAFGDGTLDVYEAAGVEQVGLIPEAAYVQKTQPQAKDAKKTQDAMRKGAGSRVSRLKTPSKSTIGRIRKQELGVAKALGARVNVRTAGDDDVCPICEAISEDGPYKLDTARGLIPAHPNCRCTFIPAGDRRFKRDDALAFVHMLVDYNPNHDPHSGQFSSGGGEGGGEKIEPEAAVPREGSRKHAVFQTYIKHGRAAAIAHAKSLGLGPNTASSWSSEWKKAGTPGGTGTDVPTFTPPPVAPTVTPPSVDPGASRVAPRQKPRRTTAKPITPSPALQAHGPARKIEIVGSGSHRGKIEAGVNAIPQEHRDLLAKRGVRVHVEQEAQIGAAGYYRYYEGPTGHTGPKTIVVAEQVRTSRNGFRFHSDDPTGTTVHELGHALDHADDWKHSSKIAASVDHDAVTHMTHDERERAKYYFSNNKERFAELYRTAYSPGHKAFGMPIERARKVFATSIEKIKAIKVV